jgi:hypothetical protein
MDNSYSHCDAPKISKSYWQSPGSLKLFWQCPESVQVTLAILREFPGHKGMYAIPKKVTSEGNALRVSKIHWQYPENFQILLAVSREFSISICIAQKISNPWSMPGESPSPIGDIW